MRWLCGGLSAFAMVACAGGPSAQIARSPDVKVSMSRLGTLQLARGEYHCEGPGVNKGYPKCSDVPVIVLEVPITSIGGSGCVVLVPYHTLDVHYKRTGGSGPHATVSWKLMGRDKYFFATSFQGVTLNGISIDTQGSVYKNPRRSTNRKGFDWDIHGSSIQVSQHSAYVSWDDGGITRECEPFDPVIINSSD